MHNGLIVLKFALKYTILGHEKMPKKQGILTVHRCGGRSFFIIPLCKFTEKKNLVYGFVKLLRYDVINLSPYKPINFITYQKTGGILWLLFVRET